jgi:hypothetical protein
MLPDLGTRTNEWMSDYPWEDTIMGYIPSPTIQSEIPNPAANEYSTPVINIELRGVQVDRNKFLALQQNAAQIKGSHRLLPQPIVVKVLVNGQPARALLDSGSLGDSMSSTLADQLNVKQENLNVLLVLQLSVQGSRSKVNVLTTVKLQYQGFEKEHTLDIINLNNYDLILGTPWMYQHQVCLGFNPAQVVIGSNDMIPLKLGIDTKSMSYSLAPEDQRVKRARA